MADEAEKYKLVLGAFVEGSAGQSLHGAPQGPGLQLGVGEAEKLLGVLALSPQETLGWGLCFSKTLPSDLTQILPAVSFTLKVGMETCCLWAREGSRVSTA